MIRSLTLTLLLTLPLAAQPQPFELPKDPKAVILSLDYAGGFTPRRQDAKPFFEILADGTMIVRDVFRAPGKNSHQGTMGSAELQALLSFVIRDQKLGDWESAAVKKALQSRKDSLPVVCDAASTVVELDIPGYKKKASLYALGFVARQAPEIEAIQRLWAIHNRLHHEAVVLRSGGIKGLKPWLKALNKELMTRWPRAKPFEIADLSQSYGEAGHDLRLTFRRTKTKKTLLYASIRKGPKGSWSIAINEFDRP